MMSKPLIVTLAILLGPAAALSAGAQPADEERARRAGLQRLLDGVEARMATIPSQRECAPRVGFEDHAAMFGADIARSPLSAAQAERIARGIVQFDNFVRYYETSVADVCRLYEQVRATAGRFERLRVEVHEPLLRAVTTIQSRLPSSPAELEEVFRAHNCYHPSRHAAVISSCLHNGTPFRALQAFVHVADDGVIRARHDARLGRDHVTGYNRYTGGSFLYRNHTDVEVVNAVRGEGGSFKFGVMATRKALHSRESTLRWAKNSLRHGPRPAFLGDDRGHLRRSPGRRGAASCRRLVPEDGQERRPALPHVQRPRAGRRRRRTAVCRRGEGDPRGHRADRGDRHRRPVHGQERGPARADRAHARRGGRAAHRHRRGAVLGGPHEGGADAAVARPLPAGGIPAGRDGGPAARRGRGAVGGPMGTLAIRSIVAGLCLLGTVGAVCAQEMRAHRLPRLDTLARAELAREEQPPVFTTGREYHVDRAARTALRRLERAERVAAARDAFEAELERRHADALRRRLDRTNVQLREEHERLAAELDRLRR